MKFLKNLLKKEQKSFSYKDFWDWFLTQQQSFFNVIDSGKNIKSDFFDKLAPQLRKIRPGFFYLTGMFSDTTAELIITADGDLKLMAFVEDLVAAAPELVNWKFTAHKPELKKEDVNINMAGIKFGTDTMAFKSYIDERYPDKIDITLYHKNFEDEEEQTIINGSYVFLDNYLGELKSVTTIDNVKIEKWPKNDPDVIPIEKLKDYLNWREKEFVEKYDGIRYDTENDSYSSYEAELKDGTPLVAIINTDLLTWEAKASHPWICILTIFYDGKTNNGFPTKDELTSMNMIEDEIMENLKDSDGFLNVGRQTGDNKRDIYFSCKDFRIPSKVFDLIERKYRKQFEFESDIYKDKYWTLHDRFLEGL